MPVRAPLTAQLRAYAPPTSEAPDMSGSYRSVFDTMLPDAVQVADPFHLVRLAGEKLDEVCRRVQNETLGHRGRKTDPLYRARKLLVLAAERLDETATGRLTGLLAAGDPKGRVTDKKRSGSCMRIAMLRSRSSGSTSCPRTCAMPPRLRRSDSSAAPCDGGGPRSPRGTTHRSPTVQPRP